MLKVEIGNDLKKQKLVERLDFIDEERREVWYGSVVWLLINPRFSVRDPGSEI